MTAPSSPTARPSDRVFTGVPAPAQIVSAEIFGPVAPTVTWTDETELLEWANASDAGPAAYVYSRDLRWAMRVAESMDAGMVCASFRRRST